MPKKTVTFKKEKETKNTIKFDEQAEPGQPPIIGSLYVQKWFAGATESLSVTIETPEAQRFNG